MPRAAGRTSPEPETPLSPEGHELSEQQEQTFLLAAVTLEGNTVFSRADLALYYEDILARLVTTTDLQAAVAQITKHYRDRGYFLTQAYLPPQDLSSGIAVIRVAEGYVERVDFEGDGERDGYVRRLASAIDEFRPIKRKDLERVLLLIGDSFGRVVENAEMAEIDARDGRYALQLTLTAKPESGVISYDNRGTDSSGKHQLWASISSNRLLDPDTQLRVGLFTIPDQPQELRYGELEISRFVGSSGTTVGAALSASESDAGGIDAIDGIEGNSRRLVLKAAHPILRSTDTSLWVNLSADVRSVSEEDNDGSNFKDQLRVLRSNLYMYAEDDFGGQNQLFGEISGGLPILGASGEGNLRSRLGADAEFLKLRASLTRQQEITKEIGIRLHAAGQVADDELLSSEEFSLGGSSIGRAYDFSELTGDHGVGGSIELQYGDGLQDDYFTWFQIFGFYDFGMVWNKGEFEQPRESLSSAGMGLRLNLTDSIRLQLEYARSLTRPVDDDDGNFQRVFVELSKNF
ncbi:ShlB/FhaC/HecB family hemolysin secretion/activation protein [Nisaea denitrificans]|uniref:ShlB/FhaC/HecB family hemolysin secretion/activation protein n=1 Tax=Nisaea denitrificans TaxID=390877 RepID=UPI00048E1DB0|nr:ShlB/FhaC/HecB family hemolysin secretion/activation protein [Nisaea denitrificans]